MKFSVYKIISILCIVLPNSYQFIQNQKQCKSNEYRCLDNTCIPENLKCDQNKNCDDNSDEGLICECDPNYTYQCITGECIWLEQKCDLKYDCRYLDDESNCPTCAEFLCKNEKCIAKSNVCNGIDDCGDNSDELQCRKCDITMS